MVKWHPIEDVLFSASYDNKIKAWKHDSSQDDWVCIKTISDHSNTVWCKLHFFILFIFIGIDFNNDGTLLLSSGDDLKIILWSVKIDNKCDINKVYELSNVHERSIFSCAFSCTIKNLFSSV